MESIRETTGLIKAFLRNFLLSKCDCMKYYDDPDWTISTDTVGSDEIGAGYVSRRNVKNGVWIEHFFVLKSSKKLEFYMSKERQNSKGEIAVIGSKAYKSPNRTDSSKKYHFLVDNIQCGVTELYCRTVHQRDAWIEAINSISKDYDATRYISGQLKHQGNKFMRLGTSGLPQWSSKWAYLYDNTFTFFNDITSCQPNNFLNLCGSIVSTVKIGDQHYCFEITPLRRNNPHLTSSSVFVFSCFDESNLKKWMVLLKAATIDSSSSAFAQKSPSPTSKKLATAAPSSSSPEEDIQYIGDNSEGNESNPNPMHHEMNSTLAVSTVMPSKEGYLLKKSPNFLGNNQSRYFVTSGKGYISYYASQQDYSNGKPEKGEIDLSSVTSIEIAERTSLILNTPKRVYTLIAPDYNAVKEWQLCIEEILEILNA